MHMLLCAASDATSPLKGMDNLTKWHQVSFSLLRGLGLMSIPSVIRLLFQQNRFYAQSHKPRNVWLGTDHDAGGKNRIKIKPKTQTWRKRIPIASCQTVPGAGHPNRYPHKHFQRLQCPLPLLCRWPVSTVWFVDRNYLVGACL